MALPRADRLVLRRTCLICAIDAPGALPHVLQPDDPIHAERRKRSSERVVILPKELLQHLGRRSIAPADESPAIEGCPDFEICDRMCKLFGRPQTFEVGSRIRRSDGVHGPRFA